MPAVADPITPAELLEAFATLQRDKDHEYGARWRDFGFIQAALFPDGITLKTVKDHSRFALLTWMLSKLSRYAANFAAGGHEDSIRDLSVYAAMLAALDQEGGPDDRNKPQP